MAAESWMLEPFSATRRYQDLYHNTCPRTDLDAPEVAPDELPDPVPLFTLPSRYRCPTCSRS